MSDCLSCTEIEQQLCDLLSGITTGGCDAQVWKEGDTTRDPSPGVKLRLAAIATLERMYKQKNCGSENELYEFVHVPCVKPHVCVGSTCASIPTVREQRRYRR